MNDIDETNRVLEVLGSHMRVQPGSIISEAIIEVISLLPSYIDRKIDERLSLEVMANEKEKHHGNDEYDVLVDGNVVNINTGTDQRAWLPISMAPKTGKEIIARVSSQYASFSCFWDGRAFAHYCNETGIVYYSPKEWKPMSEGAAQ